MMAAALMENLHGDKIQRVGRGGERVKEKDREGRDELRDKGRGVKRRSGGGERAVREGRGWDEAVNGKKEEEVKRGTYK